SPDRTHYVVLCFQPSSQLPFVIKGLTLVFTFFYPFPSAEYSFYLNNVSLIANVMLSYASK
ncbi:hypothetical protein, partial [Photobacterium damselae]|uniref:hypothetical protein n=1 Tax=Photobacterium damselae TaxID=38293 RepID=UPI004069316A